MAPPAPARVSTMKGWPKALESPSATVRASRSAAPPAANVLMMRTGRVGQFCVWAGATAGERQSAVRARSRARRRFMSASLLLAALDVVGDKAAHLRRDRQSAAHLGIGFGTGHPFGREAQRLIGLLGIALVVVELRDRIAQ